MKILILLQNNASAPTVNDYVFKQIEYLKKMSIQIDYIVNALDNDIEKILFEKTYDCIYPTNIFKYSSDGQTIISFNTQLYKQLEYFKQPFIGSDVLTHMLLNDKGLTNVRSGIGLYNLVITREMWCNEQNYILDKMKGADFPLMIKPNNLAASLGISNDSVVNNSLSAQKQINYLFNLFPNISEILAEHYLENSIEYTAAVLGNKEYLSIGITKFVSKTGKHIVYSKEEKNKPSTLRAINYTIEQNNEIIEILKYHAIRLFRLFNLRDIGRFDFLLRNDKNLYLIDANSLPSLANSFSFEFIAKNKMRHEQLLALPIYVFCKRMDMLDQLPQIFYDDLNINHFTSYAN